nr:50S ribosomal protein L25 [Saprospiraceae bacterium]
MEMVSIKADLRENLGKQASKSARRNKLVPAVIYGSDENIHALCDPSSFKKLIYTPDFRLAEVSINGNTYKCILKDVQFHPVTEEILHVDFQKLVDNVETKVSIPLKVVGTSPGVKGGGKLIKLVRKVKIKAKPENLIDTLFVDITGLELGDSKRISDIECPEGVQILNASGIPVISVEVPRVLKTVKPGEVGVEGEEGEEGEEGAEGAEGGESPEAEAGATE